MPTTYVRAEAESKEAILQAIRQGRVVLSFRPDGTFIDLSIGEAGIGDTVAVDDRKEYELSVKISGAADDRVQLWSDRGLEREWDVSGDGEQAFPVPADRLFYRVESHRYLPEQNLAIVSCLTNPVYLRRRRAEDPV